MATGVAAVCVLVGWDWDWWDWAALETIERTAAVVAPAAVVGFVV